eukprot:GFUD01009118.1.p1 GENE.GFUD01009118.1~~GFUD01009118.1.p1  ORF type:complete len:1981 (+),score=531.91 GFUD01009118.1:270-6212(+)
MAVQSRSPGEDDTKYVSVVSADDFNSFQQNGYHEDEDIDFTPQNGYLEPEDMDTQEVQGTTSKGKKAGAPKVNLMEKIAAAGSAIKNARLPSPGEIKEGYLNSAFHKSLHQPLVVKTKVEKTDVQKARQAMTQEKTPSQLGNVTSISDIPVPIIRKSKGDKMETEEEGSGMTMPRNMEELGQAAFNTLPKSMREQNIITAVKENLDPEELERNQALTKAKTPAQLAQIHSLAEFPVPEKIKNLLTFERKENEKKEPKKRRHSDCEPETAEPFTMYSTLPRSLRETKLITNVKVEPDEERLKSRQALVESKSPVELSAITSLSDIPIPSKIKRIMHRAPAASTPGSKLDVSSKSSSKGLSKMNVNDMYSTLPRAFTMELAVTTKVNKDLEEVERRKILIQEKTPMELGNIGSISEFPIPSALQNIFTKSDAAEKPEKPKRKNIEEKRKRNLTTGTFLSADFLPESWRETKLLVSSNVEEPSDLLKSRQELVESKTPAELGQINGLSDFPVPEKIQTLMRSKKRVLKSTEEKEMSKKVSGSAQSLPAMSAFMTIPSSLKSELLVKSKVEDPEIVARNKEIIKNKSVSELSQIRDISDIPIPAGIENFFKQNPVKNNVERNEKMSDSASERPTSPQSFKESIYETLPRSLRETQLLVKSKVDDDEEKVRERQELTRTKSPAELSQISSISDLPIPAPVENLLKKKSEPECPTPPPRKWKKEDIYESIPSSLRSELVVKTMVEEDVEEVELRKELIRTHTPAQLSEIHSIADFPVPKCLENLVTKTDTLEKKTGEEEAEKVPFSMEKIYGTLPTSLMDTKLLVKTLTEDPEVQAARAEIVKSKSVNELSLITSLSDIPIPEAIENFVKKSYAPAERKKKFKAMKSQSTQSLSQSMYSTLPRSLKQDLIVKSLFEDPEVLAERRVIVASKSVSELSQVTSFSDIPIPANLSRVFHKSMERLSGFRTPKQETDEIRPITPGSRSITESMYATLPKSLKNELLVKSCIEDPEIQQERRALTQSKSVSELSQIKSLSEIPIPENIEKLISRAATNKTETPEQQSLADSRPVSRGSRSVAGFKEDMYASLPRSLKDQLIVRTKVEENDEVLHQRQALVESKSPAELSEIHSLGELPIPSRIEAWLHGSNQDAERSNSAMDESPMTLPRSKKEFQEAMYKTLPTSLTQPCIVRSKVEDPNILIERQQLQQTKSIHELSKIRNLNELPIPGNLIKLPDVTLPKVKNILNYIARPAPRTPKTPNGTKSETYHSYEAAQSETVESTPLTEDKMFHGMSNGNESPTASLSNDNYEVISKPVTPEAPQIVATPPQEFKVAPQTEEQMPTPPPPEEEEQDHFSLADQIKGTPERSMRNKKKKNRRSHEVHDDMMSTDGSVVSESITSEEIPPPLPPKRVTPSPKKGMSLETQPSMEEEEIEAIPVKNKLTTVGDVLDVPRPLPPKREKQSASAEPREITEKDMTFGSNELIYVAGSNLPIMIEQLEEEEFENEIETPMVPPRAPKVARTRTPEPKISFSYTHDPRVTPTRKTSTLSHTSLTVQYNDMVHSQETARDLSPPKTLPRKRVKKAEVDKEYDSEKNLDVKPLVTPRTKTRKENDNQLMVEDSYESLGKSIDKISKVFGFEFSPKAPETLPRKSKQKMKGQSSLSNSNENIKSPEPTTHIFQTQLSDSITSESTENTQTAETAIRNQQITHEDTDFGSSASINDFVSEVVTPPPRRYATISRKTSCKSPTQKNNLRAMTPDLEERIQSRPLPPPPAPPRGLKKKSTSIDEADGRTSRSSETSYRDVHEATYTETENFRTCAESLNTSKTLRGSSNQSTKTEEDDVTLADSVVDSLVSCAETLVGDNDNLDTCADTLTGGDLDQTEFFSDDDIDNPYPSVDFDSMMAQGPGAGAKIVEEERSGRSMEKKSAAKKSESGRRLEEGTQQLSIELMEHVESLKTTLDNMSSRLGTRSRSRSHSKSRPASTFKDSL